MAQRVVADGPVAVIHVGLTAAATETINVSALENAPSEVTLLRITGAVQSAMVVDVNFDATANVSALRLPTDTVFDLDFSEFGGITNNSGAGKTGDINVTTTGASGSAHLVLYLRKG